MVCVTEAVAEQAGVTVTLYTFIWEVFGMNLRQGMASLRLSWFYSVLPGKC
jgi:hypothetical protein